MSRRSVVASDVVLEQTERRFLPVTSNPVEGPGAGNGLSDLVIHRMRPHDETLAGGLKGDAHPLGLDNVATFSGVDFDGASRVARRIELGTMRAEFGVGGVAPLPVSSSSSSLLAGRAWDDGLDGLVSHVQYNVRGLVEAVLSPGGGELGGKQQSRTLYDDLDRTIAQIANAEDVGSGGVTLQYDTGLARYQASGIESLEPSTDRVTSFVHNGLDQIRARVAHFPGSGLPGDPPDTVQVTEFVFEENLGPGVNQSDVARNDLVTQVRYPLESTGEPGSTPEYTVDYAYNAQGELMYVRDQRGTVREFTRDGLGRVLSDHATTFGGDTDPSVAELIFEFDEVGLLEAAESRDDSGVALNRIEFEYTPLWQLETSRYFHDGDTSSSTGTVHQSYSDAAVGAGNFSRPDTLTYPSGLSGGYAVRSVYSSGVNDSISRLSGLTEVGATSDLSRYEFLGLSHFARAEHVEVGVELSRIHAHNGKQWGSDPVNELDHYPGWDRYGRLRQQLWVDVGFAPGVGGEPAFPPIFQEVYEYDRDSNRVAAYDGRTNAQHELGREFAYNGLDQMVESQRGNGSAGGFSSAGSERREWNLDWVGRWTGFKIDAENDGSYSGANDLDDSPSHNQANELTQQKGLLRQYDAAGSLVESELVSSGEKLSYVYDAWRRLVQVRTVPTLGGGAPQLVAAYGYNPLHQRITQQIDASVPYEGPINELTYFFYDSNWRLIEEQVDENWSVGGSVSINRNEQYVWGARAIDDALKRRVDSDADGVVDDEYWFVADAIGSVVATLDSRAQVVERVHYSPYGQAMHGYGKDVDGDGDVDSDDIVALSLIGASAPQLGVDSSYRPEADFNRDGRVNGRDSIGPDQIAVPDGSISAIGNPIGFAGYLFNEHGRQYTVRHRNYEPGSGRFLQRDPMGYVDGTNLYQYGLSSPAMMIDPAGLQALQTPGALQAIQAQQVTIDNALAIAREIVQRTGQPLDAQTLSAVQQIINGSAGMAQAAIQLDLARIEANKSWVGLKAIGNATGHTLSFGFYEGDLFAVNAYDHAGGYSASYGAARVSSELAFGVATGWGGAQLVARGGRAAWAGYGLIGIDAFQNGRSIGGGAMGVWENPWSFQSWVELASGLAGAGGQFGGLRCFPDSDVRSSAGARRGPYLLNPPINLTEKGMAHTIQRHAAGGPAKFAGKSKFNAGENIEELIRSGTQQPMVRQPNGNFARTFDVGREIGFDRNAGGPTSVMTIITRPNGNLVTAFPGRP